MVAKRKYRSVVAGTWGLIGFLGCAMVALAAWRAWSGGRRPHGYRERLGDARAAVAAESETESRIAAFCGDCHVLPSADGFPRERWHQEVRKGYEYYARSGRNDLDPPPIHLVSAYFRALAPEKLTFPVPPEAETELRATFRVEQVDWDRNASITPAIAHLRWSRIDARSGPVLLACDMRDGSVGAVTLGDGKPHFRLLARLNQPCHIEPCDLDEDGSMDLVVADLGSFSAIDHNRGRVVWLRRRRTAASYEEVVLASGLGRVADARPSDLDGDGDLDLIVAEFGHYRTGGIYLLENVAAVAERPRFESKKLDARPGTIHLPVDDFNRDGRPDFAALVSQEYECVEMFVNRGELKFGSHNLWTGPDLTFGSAGIELADLDRDGDSDILYTNGDAFDNSYANPSHGVQWLENLDGLRFAYRRLTDLPGACRALAGDMDLDGDMDIVVTAWLPENVRPDGLRESPLASVLCLEQTSPGRFVRHTLETGSPRHAALELADFDDDGDLDFAVGSQLDPQGANRPTAAPLTVWWNQGISSGE